MPGSSPNARHLFPLVLIPLTIACAGPQLPRTLDTDAAGESRLELVSGRIVQLHLRGDAGDSVALARGLDTLARAWAGAEDLIGSWSQLAEGLSWIAPGRSGSAEELAELVSRRLRLVDPELRVTSLGAVPEGAGLHVQRPAPGVGDEIENPSSVEVGLTLVDMREIEIDGREVRLGILLLGEPAAARAAADYILQARRSGRLPERREHLARHGFDDSRFEWIRVISS